MIKFIQNGDIFASKTDVIVNAVNCVGVMGGGLALAFKNKYYDMFLEYKGMCNYKILEPGKIHWYDLRQDKMYYKLTPPKFIFNFPTKNDWRNHSKLSYIDSGLDTMNYWIEVLECKSIAIPKLGCGLGGLDWKIVRLLIISKCTLENVEYHIYE